MTDHHADYVAPPPGVIGMLESMRRSQEPKLIYVYERDWLRLQAENKRLTAALKDLAEAAEIAAQGGIHNDGCSSPEVGQ